VLVCACLCTLLVAWAAWAAQPGVWGWLSALFACALWLASPIVRTTAGDARTDFFMLVFLLAGLCTALATRAALSGRRGLRSLRLCGIALGLLCGLAVSSKLNGAPLGLCIALWMLLLAARAHRMKPMGFVRGPLAALALAGVATCIVFWTLNPRLHAEPIAGVADILARWRELFAYFQDDWAVRSGTATARTLPGGAALFLERTLARDDPWRALTGLGGGILLIVGGLVVLVWRVLRPRDDDREPALVLLVFVLVTLAATAAWLPIDWPRYYLTAAPALVLLQTLGLVTAARAVIRRWRPARAR